MSYNDERIRKELEAYQETFRIKNYYEKYRHTSILASKSSYLFNLLSVASGVVGLAALLAYLIFDDIFIMGIFALLFLAVWEIGKRTLVVRLVIDTLNKENTTSLFWVVFAFLMVSLSATIGGGIYIASVAEEKPLLIDVNTKKREVVKDSRKAVKKLEAEKAKLEDKQKQLIDRSTNPKTKKVYFTPQRRLLYRDYEQRIKSLDKAISALDSNTIKKTKKLVNKLEGQNREVLDRHESKTLTFIIIAAIISLLIELLSVLCLWYPIAFKKRCLAQRERIEQGIKNEQIDLYKYVELGKSLGLNPIDLIANFNMGERLKQAQKEIKIEAPKKGKKKEKKTEEKKQEVEVKGLKRYDNEPQEVAAKAPVASTLSEQSQEKEVKNNYPKRGKTIDYDKMRDLIKEGLKTQQIANRCNCHASTVRKFKKENNL